MCVLTLCACGADMMVVFEIEDEREGGHRERGKERGERM